MTIERHELQMTVTRSQKKSCTIAFNTSKQQIWAFHSIQDDITTKNLFHCIAMLYIVLRDAESMGVLLRY